MIMSWQEVIHAGRSAYTPLCRPVPNICDCQQFVTISLSSALWRKEISCVVQNISCEDLSGATQQRQDTITVTVTVTAAQRGSGAPRTAAGARLHIRPALNPFHQDMGS